MTLLTVDLRSAKKYAIAIIGCSESLTRLFRQVATGGPNLSCFLSRYINTTLFHISNSLSKPTWGTIQVSLQYLTCGGILSAHSLYPLQLPHSKLEFEAEACLYPGHRDRPSGLASRGWENPFSQTMSSEKWRWPGVDRRCWDCGRAAVTIE